MTQIIQIAGAIIILSAFLLAQLKVLNSESKVYLVLNLAGSAVLTWVALEDRNWGFLLLEGVWAAVSAVSLARVLTGGDAAAGH
ncbi:CBU_0592 family membrane protein [Sphaerisporangium viridialbum]|uniref:CBU_0592 family membrane protein n=1 Tax=Sphaerisporangium viridialbum TaxID=46189 RepID=UPI003C722322